MNPGETTSYQLARLDRTRRSIAWKSRGALLLIVLIGAFMMIGVDALVERVASVRIVEPAFVSEALEPAPEDLYVDEMTLRQALQAVQQRTGLPMIVEFDDLERAGYDLDAKLTFVPHGYSRETYIDELLFAVRKQQNSPTDLVRVFYTDAEFVIGSAESELKHAEVRTFDMSDFAMEGVWTSSLFDVNQPVTKPSTFDCRPLLAWELLHAAGVQTRIDLDHSRLATWEGEALKLQLPRSRQLRIQEHLDADRKSPYWIGYKRMRKPLILE
jgi:hypothetical protein